MDRADQLLLALLCKEICGDARQSVDEELREEALLSLYRLAKLHDLSHILAPALSGISLPQEISAKLAKRQMLAVFQYEQQKHALEEVAALFEKEGICFMPLKGAVIRAYYPQPWLRTSCDIDILVREEDIERATALLTEAGYRMGEKSSHDLSFFSESGVHLELHFTLHDPDFYTANALLHVWDHAKPLSGKQYHYALSGEMFCFYHIYHMAKHVMAGGCGIKPFLDLFIIRHKMGYDEAALQALLERDHLLQFATVAMRLCDVWFSHGEHNDLTQRLEQYVLEGKAYGTKKHVATVRQVKAGGKWQHVKGRIFLSFDRMCRVYPSLTRHPILFPLYQVRRWGDVFFSKRRKEALRELSINAGISKEEAAEAAAFFADIGL